MTGKSVNGASQRIGIVPRRWWLPLAIMAVLMISSSTAGPQTGGIRFSGMDKIGHFATYGMLAVAVARSLRGHQHAVCLTAVLVATLFGGTDELRQLFNPLRMFEWADLLADFLGALAGAVLYVYVSWFRLLLEWRPRLWGRPALLKSQSGQI